jgi:hypothetical protein
MTQAQQRPEMDEDMYTFPAPYINEVSPQAAERGATVTVRGEHLASVDKASFRVGKDTQPGAIVHHSEDNEVKVEIPSRLPTGAALLWVANNGGESNKIELMIQ